MTADRALAQHRLEVMANRLKQIQSGTTAAALHLEYMLAWCDEMVAAAESVATSEALFNALSDTRAAVIAAQIDLEDAHHAIETAQLRAAHTVRLVPGFTTVGR
jgi:hypothetical protein